MFVNERGMLAPVLTIAVSLLPRCPLPRQTEGGGGSCFWWLRTSGDGPSTQRGFTHV